MRPIRVLLADDHTLVRAGLRQLLHSLPDVQVVGEAGDGREALQMVEMLQPDIALMDIAMPGLNGLEATARVASDFAAVRVIILSMYSDKEYVLRALRVGAAGYLLKDATAVQLEDAIKSVSSGEMYLSSAVSKHIIADYVQKASQAQASNPLEDLTSRQREILQLIAEGNTKQAIAAKLTISPKTVEAHREQMMARLGIFDTAGLVRYAVKVGIVPSDQ